MHQRDKYVDIFIACGTNSSVGNPWNNRGNSTTSERLQSWRWCPSQRAKVNIQNGKINSDCLKKCSKMPLDYLYKEIQQKNWSFKFQKFVNDGDSPSEWDKHVNFWHELMHLFVLALQIEAFRIEEGTTARPR